MSDAYVTFYMAKIDRSSAHYFYSFNRFAQDVSEPSEMMRYAAPTMSPQWRAEMKRFYQGQRSRAEIFFKRVGEDTVAIDMAKTAVDGPDPGNGMEFLDLFDTVRRAGKRELLLEAATKAILGMPSIPQEAVWLARTAVPISATGRYILRVLDRLAVENDFYGSQDRSVNGGIDSDVLRVGDKRYPVIAALAGSIESVIEIENGVEISSWAGDIGSNRPAAAIIATVNGQVVVRTRPIGRRPDIEAGYGEGLIPTA